MSQNNISRIDSSAFTSLSILVALDLGFNSLSAIPSGLFSSQKDLLELNLNNNMIEEIPLNLLSVMPNLFSLLLNGNRLRSFGNSTFSSLPSLEKLYLQDNLLSTIAESSFSGLKELEFINLSSNRISSLSASTFNNLESLMELDLSLNNLSDIAQDIFKGTPFLMKLNLTLNHYSRNCCPNVLYYTTGFPISVACPLDCTAPPTMAPTIAPTNAPTTLAPTTKSPTVAPTTKSLTVAPTTNSPTVTPSTRSPTTAFTTVSPVNAFRTIAVSTRVSLRQEISTGRYFVNDRALYPILFGNNFVSEKSFPDMTPIAASSSPDGFKAMIWLSSPKNVSSFYTIWIMSSLWRNISSVNVEIGSAAALKYEITLDYDLNNDSIIGPAAFTPISTSSSATLLVQNGSAPGSERYFVKEGNSMFPIKTNSATGTYFASSISLSWKLSAAGTYNGTKVLFAFASSSVHVYTFRNDWNGMLNSQAFVAQSPLVAQYESVLKVDLNNDGKISTGAAAFQTTDESSEELGIPEIAYISGGVAAVFVGRIAGALLLRYRRKKSHIKGAQTTELAAYHLRI
jgi:hypothetical protein